MSTTQKTAVENYRRRIEKQGLKRLEVLVPATDAALVREAARILREDPQRAAGFKVAVRKAISRTVPAQGLKDLLAAAPLEGIDLERSPDRGREVDL